jgi:hypothetical protein
MAVGFFGMFLSLYTYRKCRVTPWLLRVRPHKGGRIQPYLNFSHMQRINPPLGGLIFVHIFHNTRDFSFLPFLPPIPRSGT